MAREGEKKRDRPNKPGAKSSVSGALFCKEHKEEGGRRERKEEKKEGEREHRRECTKRKKTHIHTRRLGSQSECNRGAAEPEATQEHLALPLIYPAHCQIPKQIVQNKNQRPQTHTHKNTPSTM